MKDEFFYRIFIDKEARTAHVETLVDRLGGDCTWYKENSITDIDPENFDYTPTIGDAQRVLRNDTGPYQYYWVTTNIASSKMHNSIS